MAWRELRHSELAAWDGHLLREPTASIRQFPFFNEGLRNSGRLLVATSGRRLASVISTARRWTTTPRYVVYESAGTKAFASIVTIGVPGFRVGCILDGPVVLGGKHPEPAMTESLLSWARRKRYVALRVTHSNEQILQTLAGHGPSERIDGVPFYPRPFSELYVNLGDEDSMLAGFQPVARRNIRQATDAGYEITVDQSPDALTKAWSAFESRSAQKGITYRSQSTYAGMMRGAEPLGIAQLYTAWRKQTPIAAILIFRDNTTSHYFLGTIDTEALGKDPSPAALLQWRAIRDAAKAGARYYNLGTRSGPVYTFKSKFRPVEHERPEPLTLIVNPFLYQFWHRVFPRLAAAVD